MAERSAQRSGRSGAPELPELRPRPDEGEWLPVRGAISEIRPGRAAARLKTPFGFRELVGRILQSLDRDRKVSFFHSDSGLLRPLADFEQYRLL